MKIELPELAENGNSVPLKLTVESPMTAADHVKAIYVFSEKNPVSNVVRFHLGPRSGVARVQTSIRLAATQRITAIARMSDGSLWSGARRCDRHPGRVPRRDVRRSPMPATRIVAAGQGQEGRGDRDQDA